MRYKRPDKKNALSILQAAEGDMKYTLSLELTKPAGSTIIRNIYESFRMLGDAIMVAKGVTSEDHIAPIKELLALHVQTKRPLNVIDNLRRLRHNINYYGYKPRIEEVEDTISLAKTLFQPVPRKIKEDISK